MLGLRRARPCVIGDIAWRGLGFTRSCAQALRSLQVLSFLSFLVEGMYQSSNSLTRPQTGNVHAARTYFLMTRSADKVTLQEAQTEPSATFMRKRKRVVVFLSLPLSLAHSPPFSTGICYCQLPVLLLAFVIFNGTLYTPNAGIRGAGIRDS